MHHDFALVATLAMFPNVNPLPGSEDEATIGDRDGFGGVGERGADVGGHVVSAFVIVGVGIILGDETMEKGFEVFEDARIGVFLDEEACGGVAQKEGAETGLNTGFGDDRLDFCGDPLERFTDGMNRDVFLIMHRE